jgi:predicted amidophosphoribosyltransferase
MTAERLKPEEIAGNYQLDDSLADPAPQVMLVFDDLLTTGSHFKAIQMVLRRRFGDIQIVGMFVARRVP